MTGIALGNTGAVTERSLGINIAPIRDGSLYMGNAPRMTAGSPLVTNMAVKTEAIEVLMAMSTSVWIRLCIRVDLEIHLYCTDFRPFLQYPQAPQKLSTRSNRKSPARGTPIPHCSARERAPSVCRLRYRLNPPYKIALNAKGRSAVWSHRAVKYGRTSLCRRT